MAKKLLNEATIRRFQTLAKVMPINEMNSMYEAEEEEMMDDAEGMEDADAAPAGEEEPMPAAEGMEMDLTEEEAQVLIELGKKLESAMGGDMAAPEAGEEMGGEEMGEEEIMEALRGISYAPSKQEVVNEVAKRVAKRLQQAKLHEAKLNRALGKRR